MAEASLFGHLGVWKSGAGEQRTMSSRVLAMTVSRLLPLAAALALAGVAPAAAQQADEPTVLQRMLGKIGLLDIPEDPIEYRERAPLVVPPSTALISPNSTVDISKIDPDWPTDPEALNRRNSPAKQKKQREQDEIFYTGERLTSEQMRRGTISKQEAAKRPDYVSAGDELSQGKDRYTPSQLGFKGWFGGKQDKPVVFEGEPERTRLTQPPSGYLTPSPNAPYGIVEKKKEDHKPETLYDRASHPDDTSRRK
jgi:hypothetical protein